VKRLTKVASYRFSAMITWARPRAKAGSVPGRITITSSPLFAVALYSTVTTTTLVPRSRASVIQWLSGIFVVIQFMPHTSSRLAFSASNSSKSEV